MKDLLFERVSWTTHIAAVVVFGVVGVIVALHGDMLIALGVASGFAIWLLPERRTHVLPRRIIVLLSAYTFAAVLPPGIGIPVQVAAVVGAFAEYAFAYRRPGTEKAVLCSLLIVIVWCIFAFNANVPSLSTGLLGVRKTVFAIGGLVLGCAIPEGQIRAAETLVVRLLTGALAVSIIVHQAFPAIEASIQRTADYSTAEFGGISRLQGIFSGPFHVAVAGVFIAGWAVLRFRDNRPVAMAVGAIGLLAMYMSLVRTAYLALAAIFIVQIFIAPGARTRLRRIGILAAIAIVGLALFYVNEGTASTAQSITNLQQDSRVQNRFPEYHKAIALIARSPVYGWGAGSAGDTLQSKFGSQRNHVTAHNIWLKVGVEGGLLGLALWGALAVTAGRRIRWTGRQGELAAVASVVIGVFGLTVSVIEALPVSYFLFLIVGLAICVTNDQRPRKFALETMDHASVPIPI